MRMIVSNYSLSSENSFTPISYAEINPVTEIVFCKLAEVENNQIKKKKTCYQLPAVNSHTPIFRSSARFLM